jgi:amidohydrolase
MEYLNQWFIKLNQAFLNYERHYADVFRQIHQNPELSGQEEETSEYLKSLLRDEAGMSIRKEVKTGFLAGYENLKLPTICARADLDALPIQEKTSLPYISVRKGVMHACGHDFHAASVYAMAHLWNQVLGERPDSPLFMFQHSEESIPGGALDFIENQILDSVSEFYGLHAEPKLNTGEISLTEGWVNARSIRFDAAISGKGGHSARPWESPDPLKVSMDIIQHLYGNLYRKADAQQPVVLTVSRLNTENESYNAIAGKVTWTGTLRITDEDLGDKLIKEISNTIKMYSENSGLKWDFSFTAGAPPVINSELSIENTKKVKTFLAGKGFGFTTFRSLGGDDFGWLSQVRPGFFIRVGVSPQGEESAPLHHSEFKVDFKAMRYAVIFYLLYFIDRLGIADKIERH